MPDEPKGLGVQLEAKDEPAETLLNEGLPADENIDLRASGDDVAAGAEDALVEGNEEAAPRLGPPENVAVEAGPRGFKVTWDQVEGASRYRVAVNPGGNPPGIVRETEGQETHLELTRDFAPGVGYCFEVYALDEEEKPGEASARTAKKELTKAEISSFWYYGSLFLVGVSVVATLALGISAIVNEDDADYLWSLSIASLVLFLFFAMLWGASKDVPEGEVAVGSESKAAKKKRKRQTRGYGVFSPIIGYDGRAGTSKIQIALWTLIIGFILVYFVGLTNFANIDGLFDGDPTGSDGATSNDVWWQYFLLLGGPFAALVLAKGITTSNVNSGELQKSSNTQTSAKPSEILKNDAGKTDLVDAQYLLFNLAAMVYVIIRVADESRLPEIPTVLLALTGSSAAAYTANKAAIRNKPAITSVVPSTASPGDEITIYGRNFMPEGDDGTPPTVTVNGLGAQLIPPTASAASKAATDTLLTVKVPPEATEGLGPVVLTTAASVATNAHLIQIAEREE